MKRRLIPIDRSPAVPVALLTFIICLGQIASPVAYAQADDKVVVLNHADSLVGAEINGEKVKELFGNVRFTQGKVTVSCRQATQYLASNKIGLEGEVEVLDSAMRMVGSRGMYYSDDRIAEAFDRVQVEDQSTTLKADYGKYFVREKKAFFRGHVSVEDTGSNLTADSLIYFRGSQRSVADGDVVIMNHARTTRITGEHFDNDRKLGYSKMIGEPVYTQTDTAGGRADTLTVKSRIMESYKDTLQRVVATDSVRLTRSGLRAQGEQAVFLSKLDSIILRQTPYIWYTTDSGQENQLSGDSIFIRLVQRKLDRVYVRGRARAISEVDSIYPDRYNQMTGQEIILYFGDRKILRIDVDGTATSLYYLFDGKKPNGVNKTSGDHVRIFFKDGKIDKLKVTNSVEGQYFPERLVSKRESSYNLLGFNWKGRSRGARKQVPSSTPPLQ